MTIRYEYRDAAGAIIPNIVPPAELSAQLHNGDDLAVTVPGQPVPDVYGVTNRGLHHVAPDVVVTFTLAKKP